MRQKRKMALKTAFGLDWGILAPWQDSAFLNHGVGKSKSRKGLPAAFSSQFRDLLATTGLGNLSQ
jgi:hypothetical protein